MKPWYEKLFENFSRQYEAEVFTQGTVGECEFIEQEAGYDKKIRILDIGCGTGRHSIELTKRGYTVTGIDLSESMLAKAKQNAAAHNVTVDFQQHDARNLPFDHEFDLAIMLCEGGFPLMETDEMNYQILERAAKALKDNGKLIFTTLNGLFPLFHSVMDFIEKQNNTDITDGFSRRSSDISTDGFSRRSSDTSTDGFSRRSSDTTDLSFDLMTFRDLNKMVMQDDDGKDMELEVNERYYVPSEITWLLKSLGFKKIDIFGAKLGAFSRINKLTTEDFEMLVVAEGLERRA